MKNIFTKMRQINFIFTFFTLLISCKISIAQTIPKSIKATIVNEVGKPVSYATIYVIASDGEKVLSQQQVDSTGKFELHIGQEIWSIQIRAMGFKSKDISSKNFLNNDGKSTFSTIVLEQDLTYLDEIVVTGKHKLVEVKGNKTIVNVSKSSLSVGSSALEIIRRAPGLNVGQDGSISLRGRQGVNVLINGSATNLTGDQLKDLLKSTPSGLIETIEIIDNPSSNYDASGSSGVINITLKKEEKQGLNGNLSGGMGYGNYEKHNLGLDFNYGFGKLNFYGNISNNYDKMKGKIDILRSNRYQNQLTHFNQQSLSIGTSINTNYKLGLDYYISKQHSLGFEYKRFTNSWNDTQNNNSQFLGEDERIDSLLFTEVNGKNKYKNDALNLSYKFLADTSGQQLSLSVDYTNYRNTQSSNYFNVLKPTLGSGVESKSNLMVDAPTKITVGAVSIDYKYNFENSSSLDFGIKSSQVKTNNFFSQLLKEQKTENLNDRFLYDEKINAGFVKYKFNFMKLDIESGFRVEQTKSINEPSDKDGTVKRNYWDFFPSINLTKNISDKSQLSFNYNRRIDRPAYSKLNPFVFFTDPYTYLKGNPFLRPQYTNSFSLNYSINNFIVSLSHKRTKDFMTGVIILDTLRKHLFQTTENIYAQNSTSLNVNREIKILKNWTTYNNITVYQNKFLYKDFLGSDYNLALISFNFTTNHQYKISDSFSLEASFNYQSKEYYAQDVIKPIYFADLGLSKNFFNNKVNLKIAVNDVFNTSNYKFYSNIKAQDYTFNIKPETRVYRLNLSYKFGGTKSKSGMERKQLEENFRIETSNCTSSN